MNDTIAE